MSSDPPLSPRGRAVRRITVVVLLALVAATVIAFLVREGPDGGATVADPPAADVERTRTEQYTVDSTAADRKLVQTVVRPEGDVADRPLLIFLTGKNQDPAQIGGDVMRAAVGRLGDRAPIVVLPANDGGSYWHDRRSGRWREYVLDEAIPAALRRYDLDPARVAIGGISMGGAGAFSIAARSDRPFCAVGGHSAAFWPAWEGSAPGAYDDAEDFRRNEPMAAVLDGSTRYGVPLWLDIGRSDPFVAANRQVADALRRNGEQVTARFPSGDHDGAYWRAHMADWLAFYADALADCA
ncbi:MAG: alpha/beta hydrolase-fold protein [Patulibacter sp.]